MLHLLHVKMVSNSNVEMNGQTGGKQQQQRQQTCLWIVAAIRVIR